MSSSRPPEGSSLSNLPVFDASNPSSALTKLATVSAPVDIPTADVVKIIQQYLHEQGLHRSLHTLQEESQVATNTVNNLQSFMQNIENGEWDRVLSDLSSFRIPLSKLIPLYDQIVLELCEVEEFETAKAILNETPVMSLLKSSNDQRYARLLRLIQTYTSDPSQLYEKISRKQRRANVVATLKTEVVEAPRSRLLQIITNSLRYQQFIGTLPRHVADYNIFTDSLSKTSIEMQRPAIELVKTISLIADGEADVVQVSLFTWNGKYLITGNDKGIIEIWDIDKGKVTQDLEFQRKDEYMMHFHPITTMSLSHDNEVLATGANNGEIKVWALYTGQCLIHLKQAHDQAITTLQLSPNGLFLLSSSQDNCVKVWNLQNQTNTYSYQLENPVIFACFPSLNATTTANNTVLILDALGVFYLYIEHDLVLKKNIVVNSATETSSALLDRSKDKEGAKLFRDNAITTQNTALTLYSAGIIPIRPDVLLLCSKGDRSLHLIDDKSADVLQSYPLIPYANKLQLASDASESDKQKGLSLSKADLTHICTSALARYIYAIGTNNFVVVFNFDTRKVEAAFNPHNGAVIQSICHHPHRNVFVTTASDGLIKIWK